VEYRNALVRPRPSGRDERFRIHRDDGQATDLEAIGLLSVIAILAVELGLVAGVPRAMALNDSCTSLKC